MTNSIITQEELKEQLHYDPKTGLFTRLKTGKIAGSLNHGYIRINIYGVRYLSHRLAWLYTYGYFPTKDLDHINNIKSDNQIINLREATRSENMRNVKLKSNNVSGFKCVCYYKREERWVAKANLNGKTIIIGYFKDPELASKAYKSFAQQHYGEFYKE